MNDLIAFSQQVRAVGNYEELLSVPYSGATNAICWARQLEGDFAEIVQKTVLNENMMELDQAALRELPLSDAGNLAREAILRDLKVLTAHGAAPILNLIRSYDRDDSYPFFPTDVYSFHVDRSPVPGHTFLCTYYGASSDIIPNAGAKQKVLIPEIRKELRTLYDGPEEGFDAFLREYFFDLHYQANPDAKPVSLGLGNLWRLAIDHSESEVLPCIHRAPREKPGQTRLMLIC